MPKKGNGHPWLFAFTFGVFFFLYLPLVVLALFSFNSSRLMMNWQGFTTLWFRILIQDSAMFLALSNSLWIAFWTTVLSLLLGVPAGVALSQDRQVAKGPFEILILLPLVVPEIVLAVAFAAFYGAFKIRLSFTTVVLTHTAFSLSYVILLVRSRMSKLNPALVEAAKDLCADDRTVFRRVILPHLMPAVIGSSLLVFTLSLDDYVITSFVAGVGNTTLPLKIYSMTKEGLTPEINAMCASLLGITLLMAMLSYWVQANRVTWKRMGMVFAVFFLGLAWPMIWHHGIAGGRHPALNLFIWSGYLAPDTVQVFEQRFGIRVECDLYDSTEALLAKLQAGNAGYDVVVPSDYTVQILRQRALLSPIDKREIPNLEKFVDPHFLNRPFDPGNRYSVPYIWGVTGIGYRQDLVREDVKNWNVLWKPQFSGKIVMLDDMRENFGAALKSLGYSINSRKPEEIEQARHLLAQQKPLLQAYNSSNFQDLLASGDAWLVQGWNGQIVKAAQDNPQIKFALPEEGSTVFVDSLCIPSDAPHKQLAHRFINYLLEPETAASIMNYTGYVMPNRAARPYVRKTLRDNPALFPSASQLNRCEMIEDLGESILLYDRLWTEIKSK